MIQLQVFISGLILLLSGAVDSSAVVQGLEGHPVTLPCNYSTYHGGIVPSCWGRGECHYSYCLRTLIWTNGYKVTHQRSNRYKLKGNISEGNVSLTIENTAMSDGGPYCCVVELPGAFYFVDNLLEVKAEIPTSSPTRPTMTGGHRTARPTATGRTISISTRSTVVPTPTRVSTFTPPKPAHTETHRAEATTFYPDQTTAEVKEIPSYTPADSNKTVTSSKSWYNNTEAISLQKPQKNLTKGFYVGMFIASLLLLLIVSTVAITRFTVMRKKSGSLSFLAFPVSMIGVSQKKVVDWDRFEDKVYIIEDSPNPKVS